MGKAWDKLMKRKRVRGFVRSWFKSLEITYNKIRKDYHPHFHALLMVPKEYFEKDSGLYMTHEELLRLWKLSMRDDRITQVDIRVVRADNEKELESMAAEVAKYATKPMSYIEEDSKGKYTVDPKVVEELYYGLKGRRLVGFGGYFKKIREERKMIDVEKANLNDMVEDEASGEDVYEEGASKAEFCKICGEPLVEEMYVWDDNVEDYLRVDPPGDPPDG
jgi:plasmid rolling circle replication initiator protein Rep